MPLRFHFGANVSLLVTKVPRNLDRRLLLFGFELADLLIVFLYLSLSNLFFGTTKLKFPIVWLGTFAIAGTLFFIKRGKPEGYLQHLVQFKIRPTAYTAGTPDIKYQSLLMGKGSEHVES